MKNNQLTSINEGSTHENNKYGGVPVGGNNTVEQGETINNNGKNKYVYSNRLFINETLTKDNNLPSYIKGKSFSKASEEINKKFKDRNDKHSLETKKVFLERLKEAQEALKQQEQQRAEQIAQSMRSNQQEVPDMMNGQIPEGMEEFTEQPKQFFAGGDITSSEIGNQTGGMSGLSGKMSPYLGAFGQLTNIGKSLHDPNKSKEDKGADVAEGVTLGAADIIAPGAGTVLKTADSLVTSIAGNSDVGKGISSMISPLSTIKGLGSAIATGNISDMPAIGMFTKNSTANKNKIKDLNNNALNYNKQFQDNNFAYGGDLTSKPSQYADGGYTTSGDPLIIPNNGMSSINERFPFESMFKPTNTLPQVGFTAYQSPINEQYDNKNIPLISKMNVPNSSGWDSYKSYGDLGKSINVPKVKEKEDKPGSLFSRNAGKFLKYAPVAMNAYQLATLKKPENRHLQRLSDKYKAQYVDEAQLQNIANQEMTNTINGISQSGASQGAIRSSILGAGLNKTKALSDAYMKANAENRATDDKGQTFNLGVNQFNTQTQHQESENWERNKAAYDTEKSKLLGNIGENLGNIGKEEVNKNQIAEALGYEWDGKYHINKKTGEKLTTDEMKNKIDNLKNNKTYNFKGKDFSNTSINYTPTNFKIGRG